MENNDCIRIQNCNNYRGIKPLSDAMEAWYRVIKMRMKRNASTV